LPKGKENRNSANTLPEPNPKLTFAGLNTNMTRTSRVKLRSGGNEKKHHVKVSSVKCRDQIIHSDVSKCLVVVDTSLTIIDVIQYRKKFWLVPEWIDSSDCQWCTPRRIIWAEKLRRYDLRAIGTEAADFTLDETLSEDLLKYEHQREDIEVSDYKRTRMPNSQKHNQLAASAVFLDDSPPARSPLQVRTLALSSHMKLANCHPSLRPLQIAKIAKPTVETSG
jgi:hypothetical protein